MERRTYDNLDKDVTAAVPHWCHLNLRGDGVTNVSGEVGLEWNVRLIDCCEGSVVVEVCCPECILQQARPDGRETTI